MDPLWIALAFLLGLVSRTIGLPPLVGFLAAGFVLQHMGVESGPILERLADLGVLIMLFGIGLKLNLRSLARPEVWATTCLHMGTVVVIFTLALMGLSLVGIHPFTGLEWSTSMMLAFALSFSSTVFAVKILEEQGTSGSLYGRTSVGILIVQDIIAVLFLSLALGKVPTWWALALVIAMPLLRHVCMKIMDRTGHGELVVLLGLSLALVVGARLFEAVGLKPDLGALVIGLLVADHPKSSELSKSLLSFKDLFLVGFFLSIGLSGEPSMQTLGLGLALLPFILFKGALFHVLLTGFTLRGRTAFLSAMTLTNYSEFGLIVGALAVRNGWLDPMWLTAVAIAVALSFASAASLNASGLSLYDKLERFLCRFEGKRYHPEEQPIAAEDILISVVGMGRVGQGAYDWLQERYGDVILGLDVKPAVVADNREQGRNVLLGDVTDRAFLGRLRSQNNGQIKLTLLTLGQAANLRVIEQVRKFGYRGKLVAVARFEDQVPRLIEAGADEAFNLYVDAGAGFAEHTENELRKRDDCHWIEEYCLKDSKLP